MNWYRKSSVEDTQPVFHLQKDEAREKYWAIDNAAKDKAREEYLSSHPDMNEEDREALKKGHGVFIHSCGHKQMCRCSHGGSFVMKIPLKCETCYLESSPKENSKFAAKNSFESLEQMGYNFRTTRVSGFYTTINVYIEGEWVGEATFNESSKSLPQNEMYASNSWVDPKHQRLGLATAMYQMAERETGKKIRPTSNQTDDAKKLWEDPNRVFGKETI